MYRILSLLFFWFLPVLFFGQKVFNVGEKVKFSADMLDSLGNPVAVPIPDGLFTLFYQYNWAGKNNDTKDSIKILKKVISKIIEKYKLKSLRVVCYSLDEGAKYKQWLLDIKTPPFKIKPTYTVEYYNTDYNDKVAKVFKKTFEKLTLIAPDAKLLVKSNSIGGFEKQPSFNTTAFKLKGKLLTDSAGIKSPLINTLVYMFNDLKADTSAKAVTDKFGDFEIPLPDDEKSSYELKVDAKKAKIVILASQDGTEISRFNKTLAGFEYRLLKVDIVKLSEPPMEVDDISMLFKKFHGSGDNELKVIESISYASGKFNIQNESEQVLNKVVKILIEHPNVKLEVISHTDSQGNDASNQLLSEKRSASVIEYLVAKGIVVARLKAIGKGETVIRNRCLNGIDCSDKEHEFNRRTEFNFTKG